MDMDESDTNWSQIVHTFERDFNILLQFLHPNTQYKRPWNSYQNGGKLWYKILFWF